MEGTVVGILYKHPLSFRAWRFTKSYTLDWNVQHVNKVRHFFVSKRIMHILIPQLRKQDPSTLLPTPCSCMSLLSCATSCRLSIMQKMQLALFE